MARWYIIHAYSGFEGKVRDSIMAEATRMGLEQLVEQIEVPTETTTDAAAPKQKVKVDYEIGDQVKVLDGPFATFNGLVEELDFDRSRVKVSVSIFGRATPVELEFEQVERSK